MLKKNVWPKMNIKDSRIYRRTQKKKKVFLPIHYVMIKSKNTKL